MVKQNGGKPHEHEVR